jgi:signal transduction histidine kinase/ActR/RegA family two-component response regulator
VQEIQVFLETGKPLDTEFRIVQKSGNVMWVHAIAKTISDGENRPLLTIGTLQNITDQRHLEERARHAQKMESIATLAGGIAHDFNNILGIILGNAELALEELPEMRGYREFISSIQTAGLRGREVVKQLTDFTRKSDSPHSPMDILPILKESLKLIEARLGPGIRIIRHLPPSCPPILADAMLIHQLLNNLFANAIDAIENQGEIEISMGKLSLGGSMEMPVPDMDPGDYLFMTLKDSGRGIEQENIKRIFDPYFTTKDIGKGSGLGLSVVHGIMQSHHGFIHVESAPGQGTSVSIYFPVLEEIDKAPAPVLEKPAKGSETILYVDDEEALVSLGESLLNKLGYTVKGCMNPREALDLFKAAPTAFDLIITDLSMPGLTGDELAGEIHRISPQTPIILYSGFTDLMDEKAARDLGIRQFLTKPVDFRTLAQSLRDILDNR